MLNQRGEVMNKSDVCRELHNAAEFHLFGPGSWPADKEAAGAFWKLLDDFGLTAAVPDEPRVIEYTPLGLELNAELMMIFAGATNLWDIPLLLDLMGYLDDEEADAIYNTTSQHPEHVIRRHVLRVYFKVFNRSNILN